MPRSVVRGNRLQLNVDALGLPPKLIEVVVTGPTTTADVALSVGFTEQVTVGSRATGVDLNAIPVSAIDRIEVLRDGASAQYGSDAIAGVINIVLKGGVAAPTVTTNFGLSKGTFAGNRCTPNGLTCSEGAGIDFSDGGLADLGGSWGLAAGKGSVTVAAEYRHHNFTNRASLDPRDQLVAGDAGNNVVAEPNHRWGDPDTRDTMTFVNASVPLDRAERASSTASAATAAASPAAPASIAARSTYATGRRSTRSDSCR